MTATSYPVHPGYPVHVDAALDRPLSRWLWLVKWLLALPHYVVLAFLWLGFALLSVVAFFAILVTGRYPRAVFDFNVGVLRWTWRVTYYAYGALGTDRYPPFSLGEEPDYPAHLSVEYPQHLSRGLVLVKWWLLAIPHYIVVGFFVGGGAWAGTRSNDNWQWGWGGGGLVGILVLVAAVVLAVTGSYPRPLYDLILGMNRWVLRVAGYAALMTDRYPPFRLDLGGEDPGRITLPPAPGPDGPGGAAAAGVMSTTATTQVGAPTAPPTVAGPPTAPPPVPGAPASVGPPPAARSGWTAGRVVGLVAGALVTFVAVGLLTAGTALTVADHALRDSDGYLTSHSVALSSDSYAIRSESIRLEGNGPTWALPSSVLGTARVRVVPAAGSGPLFAGLAPTERVDSYLATVRYDPLRIVGDNRPTYTAHSGSAPTTPPTELDIWTSRAAGTGPLTLTWKPSAGDWTIVVMRADASSGVAADAEIGATVPSLGWVAVGLLVAGALALLLGVLVVVLVIRSVSAASRYAAPR